jgi:hypothetical protein
MTEQPDEHELNGDAVADAAAPAYEPDVEAGQVLDPDELAAEIADDDGMEDASDAPDAPDDVLDRTGDSHGAAQDAALDHEIEVWDDGGSTVGRTESVSGALPFVVSAREEFAALGDVPVTGDARVDAATARLAEVGELPTSDHVAVYDDVHRRLQDALSDADVR